MASLREHLLLGLGNPLLDISANTDESLLKKYDLDANSAILAAEKHLPLYDELESTYKVEYIAGGATQNVMRIAQWILQKPNVCSFMGCVGKDKYSKTLEEISTKAGVNVRYQYNNQLPTGTCAVLVTKNGTCRSLVANLAAANNFTIDHINVEQNRKLVDEAQYYFISGFFLVVSLDTIMDIGSHSVDKNKVFAMSLSAPYICEVFGDRLMQAYPYIDYLFGNETEAASFASAMQFGTTDIKTIALRASALPKKGNRKRTVIITQGAENIVVATDGKITEFPVCRLAPEKIIDTNGAGDAFAGGFMAQLVQGKPIEECIRCGIWSATEIIQRSGCTCPEGVKFS